MHTFNDGFGGEVVDHPEYFAREDAYNDVRTDYLCAEDHQGMSKKFRLEWVETSPYSEERYLQLYNKYYDEAVVQELRRAKKILDFYNEMSKKVESARPTKCSNCDTTYDACTKGLFKANGTACCGECATTATHAQDA